MVDIQIKKAIKAPGTFGAFITFPFDNNLVGIVREQSARFWHAESKTWEIPVSGLMGFINKASDYEITIKGEMAPEVVGNQMPAGFSFKTKPFQHQIDGFHYGLKKDAFLLGDEQGLGKTKQVIDIAIARKLKQGYKHCLIICGINGLKWNWEQEIKIHSEETGFILGSRIKKTGKNKGHLRIGSNSDKLDDLMNLPSDYFLITNVETLRHEVKVKVGKKSVSTYPFLDRLKELIANGTIGIVAIDEIHKCKNSASQQGKAILELEPPVRIAMTGTVIMNNPLDAYIVLKWLGYEKHNFYQFKNHYVIKGDFNAVTGYKNLHELRAHLADNMLRRLKKDVLDLPAKLSVVEYVEMDAPQAKIYAEVKEEIKHNIDMIKISPNPLAQLIRLRQATGYTGILSSKIQVSCKLDRMEELIEEFTENGHKCLVFSNWVDVTTPALDRLTKYNPAEITGRVKDRDDQKHKFMNDPSCKVIVGTIGAMGTGLTLTAATKVIFLDEPWNRALKDQAEDRAHRIGTTENITIITILVKDTIDERIFHIVNSKGEMADMLVDGAHSNSRPQLVEYLLS